MSKRKVIDILDHHAIYILAGIFSVTNLGQPLPPVRDVQNLRETFGSAPRWRAPYPRVGKLDKVMARSMLDASVTTFCQHLCETDEMLEMFMEEGKAWAERLSVMSVEKIETTWPDAYTIYLAASPSPIEANH